MPKELNKTYKLCFTYTKKIGGLKFIHFMIFMTFYDKFQILCFYIRKTLRLPNSQKKLNQQAWD